MWRVRFKFKEREGIAPTLIGNEWKCDYKGTWTFKSLINHLFDERWMEYLARNGKEITAVYIEWAEEEVKEGDFV